MYLYYQLATLICACVLINLIMYLLMGCKDCCAQNVVDTIQTQEFYEHIEHFVIETIRKQDSLKIQGEELKKVLKKKVKSIEETK